MNLVFSHDSKQLDTNSLDAITKVWDVVTGKELLSLDTPFPNADALGDLACSQDDRQLYVSVQDGMREFVMPIEDLMQLARTPVMRTLTQEECIQYLHQQEYPQ